VRRILERRIERAPGVEERVADDAGIGHARAEAARVHRGTVVADVEHGPCGDRNCEREEGEYRKGGRCAGRQRTAGAGIEQTGGPRGRSGRRTGTDADAATA